MLKYFLFLALASSVQGDCPKGCPEPMHIYEGLKCTPIFEKPSDCCPIKFDCSNLEQNPKDKCVYQGKFFEAGNAVEEAEANCQAGCVCTEGGDIACTELRCPELRIANLGRGCHYKYEPGKCCALGYVCPYSNDTFKCKVEGKTYLEGQRFKPKDKNCVTCVCRRGFNGEFVEPFCKKDTCSDEIEYRKEIDQHCAPAYYTGDCCPREWVCPEQNDVIQRGPENPNPDLKCKFGNQLLDIGAKFNRTDVDCECKLPPFITCRNRIKVTILYSDI